MICGNLDVADLSEDSQILESFHKDAAESTLILFGRFVQKCYNLLKYYVIHVRALVDNYTKHQQNS
jgi:hypothetical protein